MPFAFLIVGIFFVAAGVKGNSANLLQLLKGDMTGQNNYLYWLMAIVVIGSIGYVDELRPLSRAFLLLILIVLILTKGNPQSAGGGFFTQFETAVKQIANRNNTSN